MSAKPRRWFRFSLRTLLILITLVACWLGWESNVVRGRKQLMQEMELRPGVRFLTADLYAFYHTASTPPEPVARVSTLRRWLGDQAIQEIEYTRTYHKLSPAEIAQLARTFPEAKVREAEPLPIPCHPGCFPTGTPVETPAGPRPIETLAPGDLVIAYLPSGEQILAPIQEVFTTENHLWRISTEAGDLITTETQPLCLAADNGAADRTIGAGELQAGDEILRAQDGSHYPVRVLAAAPTGEIARVYNLILGERQLFIAGGYLARSKPPAITAANGSP
jgi:hypothetical protein